MPKTTNQLRAEAAARNLQHARDAMSDAQYQMFETPLARFNERADQIKKQIDQLTKHILNHATKEEKIG
jgi:hypothetical protein